MEQIEWAGICPICFWPVECGKELCLIPPEQGGRTFHKTCAERCPDAYYLKLERRKQTRRAAKGGAKNEQSN